VRPYPSRGYQAIFWLVFGGALAYCVYGLIAGDLYFVGKSGRGAHLHGVPAWCFTAFVTFLGAGVWMREFSTISSRYRTRFEILFLVSGFFLLVLGWNYSP
jgi:hypothetical protein